MPNSPIFIVLCCMCYTYSMRGVSAQTGVCTVIANGKDLQLLSAVTSQIPFPVTAISCDDMVEYGRLTPTT